MRPVIRSNGESEGHLTDFFVNFLARGGFSRLTEAKDDGGRTWVRVETVKPWDATAEPRPASKDDPRLLRRQADVGQGLDHSCEGVMRVTDGRL